MKCLNKIWKSILSPLLFLLAFTQIDLINAKENENIPREIEMLFSGLDDNESVIELPNGGYIYGDGRGAGQLPGDRAEPGKELRCGRFHPRGGHRL